MSRLSRPFFISLAATALAACTTTTQFSSNPPGAEVTYLNKVIGVTPFQYEVQDQFGWFSVYEFKATRAGHASKVLSFYERTPLDHNNVIPKAIHFDLEAAAKK
ncbi:MAG: hypothetical protein C4K60_02820 [Ideonella sp. MAG2]|nr:MAG: hypothetical protein C4K60_02820 [Ideonella sp. MAG2]